MNGAGLDSGTRFLRSPIPSADPNDPLVQPFQIYMFQNNTNSAIELVAISESS